MIYAVFRIEIEIPGSDDRDPDWSDTEFTEMIDSGVERLQEQFEALPGVKFVEYEDWDVT